MIHLKCSLRTKYIYIHIYLKDISNIYYMYINLVKNINKLEELTILNELS
jgi:hypothetical protein